MREYRIIDADQHIIEPPDIWEKALPARYRERAPRLVKDEDGGDAWLLGEHRESLGLVTVVGKPYQEFRWTGVTYAEIDPGCYEPKRRLELMDVDGVDAAVIYPAQRTMHYFMQPNDPEFHRVGIRAYNQIVLDFCAYAPDRLKGIAQIPNMGLGVALEELRRYKELGACGVAINTWPSGGTMIGPEDDPFWAAAEEMGMPVIIHIALVSGNAPRARTAVSRGGWTHLAGLSLSGLGSMPSIIAHVIFSGVCERFPNLRFVAAEVGAGWVPSLKQDMDDRYLRNRGWTGVAFKRMPSEYFNQNWLVGIIRDPYGVRNRYEVGVGNMLWASDFPHHINDWPYSRRLIDEMSLGVPEEDRRRIFCENAGRLYGFIGEQAAAGNGRRDVTDLATIV
jgi:predicted TIM-barrel fold metal-dependent hydrolase